MSEFKVFGKIARLNRDVVVTEKIDGTNAQILIEKVLTEAEGGPVGDEVAVVSAFNANAEVVIYGVFAGSRSRWLCPERDGAKTDNFGFGAWVAANAVELVALLGEGRHFGEWWGAGVQRKYGQETKRFSLFNVSRYGEQTAYLDERCVKPATGIDHKYHKGAKVCQCRDERPAVRAEIGGVPVDSVPVLYRGPWHGPVYDRATKPTIYDVVMTDEKPEPRNGWAPALALQKLETEGSAAAPGFMKPEGIVVFHEAGGQLFKATVEGDEKPKGAA